MRGGGRCQGSAGAVGAKEQRARQTKCKADSFPPRRMVDLGEIGRDFLRVSETAHALSGGIFREPAGQLQLSSRFIDVSLQLPQDSPAPSSPDWEEAAEIGDDVSFHSYAFQSSASEPVT